MIVQLKNYFN